MSTYQRSNRNMLDYTVILHPHHSFNSTCSTDNLRGGAISSFNNFIDLSTNSQKVSSASRRRRLVVIVFSVVSLSGSLFDFVDKLRSAVGLNNVNYRERFSSSPTLRIYLLKVINSTTALIFLNCTTFSLKRIFSFPSRNGQVRENLPDLLYLHDCERLSHGYYCVFNHIVT